MQKAKKAGNIANWSQQAKERKTRSKIGARCKGKARANAKGQRLPIPTGFYRKRINSIIFKQATTSCPASKWCWFGLVPPQLHLLHRQILQPRRLVAQHSVGHVTPTPFGGALARAPLTSPVA